MESMYAVFEGPGRDFILDKANIPALTEGEILIRNVYCTLCRSDLNTFIGIRIEKTPTILGHEIIGRIEKFGPETPLTDNRGHALKTGDLVTWAIYASDPGSVLSQKGIPQKASGLFKYGHEEITLTSNLHGGLSEYTILRKHTPVVAIKRDVPYPVTALINCSVATVAGALRLAGNLAGQTVLINGTGMLGIIACAMCRVNGAGKIIAVDSEWSRVEVAGDFGADYLLTTDQVEPRGVKVTISGKEQWIKPDVVLEFSGIPEAMEKTLRVLDTGGIAVWIGAAFPQRDIALNAEYLIRNILTVKGLHNYNELDFLFAVNFIEQYHAIFDFYRLVKGGFSLMDVNEAFRFAIEKNPFRVGINLI